MGIIFSCCGDRVDTEDFPRMLCLAGRASTKVAMQIPVGVFADFLKHP